MAGCIAGFGRAGVFGHARTQSTFAVRFGINDHGGYCMGSVFIARSRLRITACRDGGQLYPCCAADHINSVGHIE